MTGTGSRSWKRLGRGGWFSVAIVAEAPLIIAYTIFGSAPTARWKAAFVLASGTAKSEDSTE